jgi:regulator of protease activity HflC (stomatin/prohibitin superfamily)
LPVVEATVDEIAFAIVEAERESSAAYRRADALKRLYKLAREAGCIGADRAATAVMKKEGQ